MSIIENVYSESEIFCDFIATYAKMVPSAEGKKQEEVLKKIYKDKLTPLGTNFTAFYNEFKKFYNADFLTKDQIKFKEILKKWTKHEYTKLGTANEKINWLKENITSDDIDNGFDWRELIQEARNLYHALEEYIKNVDKYNNRRREINSETNHNYSAFKKYLINLVNDKTKDSEKPENPNGYIDFFYTNNWRCPEERLKRVTAEPKLSILKEALVEYQRIISNEKKLTAELKGLEEQKNQSQEEYKRLETSLHNQIINHKYVKVYQQYKEKKDSEIILKKLSEVNKSLKLPAENNEDRINKWKKLLESIKETQKAVSKESGFFSSNGRILRKIAKQLQEVIKTINHTVEFLDKKQ